MKAGLRKIINQIGSIKTFERVHSGNSSHSDDPSQFGRISEHEFGTVLISFLLEVANCFSSRRFTDISTDRDCPSTKKALYLQGIYQLDHDGHVFSNHRAAAGTRGEIQISLSIL